MHASPEFDVAIVGARVAGAATALLLARAGLKVVVLDRTTYGNDTLSTHALMRAGVMQLSRWGLLDDVIASGTPAVRRTTFFVGPDPLVISIKPAYGVDALYAPRRTVLDPMLVDAAAAAGADIRFGVTVSGLERGDDGRVTGLVGHDAGGAPVHVRARLVVGADGPGSSVAEWVGAEALRHGPRRRCRRLRLLGGPRPRRLRVVLPPRRDRGCHPHQRRADLRVRRHHAGAFPRRAGAPAAVGLRLPAGRGRP